MELEDIDRIAPPGKRTSAGVDLESGEICDLADRRVVTWNPFRVQERQRAGVRHRNGLRHLENATSNVRSVDREADTPGQGMSRAAGIMSASGVATGALFSAEETSGDRLKRSNRMLVLMDAW